HLSAGAYLDPKFCLDALRKVYYRTNRLVAPSHGFDAIAVLGHCLRARRALVVRDALLVGLLGFASWLSLITVLATLAILLAVHACVVSLLVVRKTIRYIVSEGYFPATVFAAPAPAPASESGAGHAKQGTDPAQERPPRLFVRLWLANMLVQIGAQLLGIALRYLALLAVAVLL